MSKVKDWTEQHPFDEFPLTEEEKAQRVKVVDEDARLDYQQQREEEVSSSMDSYFAPSEGYR